MNIINIENITKTLGGKTIFHQASFGISEGDKIGIVGINGTGKSTLLKMIAGEESVENGQIVQQNGKKIAYLRQNPDFPEKQNVNEYALTGEPEKDWQVQSNLNELGITDGTQILSTLSGGQRRRVALAKVLAEDFDVLLLDEPTNHLDDEMISWLEAYLKSFRGTLVMVTHDRYFLDQIANKILEISQGQMFSYDTDYSGFLELKAQRETMEVATARKQQSILRMEMEWAKRGCRARTTKQKARLERLEMLKNAKGPVSDGNVMLSGMAARMGKKLISLENISKSFGEKVIVKNFTYTVLKNQRLGIVGPNGCGKSTLMKMIAGMEKPDSGEVEIGETMRIGFFSQEEQHMPDEQRVIDYIKDIAEYVTLDDGKISASQLLERFLFTSEMQYAPIGKLSGGEKRRLYLCSILCQELNVLLLDEPGNNLDIPTLTILEDYITSFPGIVITVSHDRYFLDDVVDRIFAFEGDGEIHQYEGGYTDYILKKNGDGKEKNNFSKNSSNTEDSKSSGKSWKQNVPTKLKFTYNEKREYETIDDDIASLEAEIEKCNSDMEENATNSSKLAEITVRKHTLEKQLEEKMDRWVYLNDLAEKIATDN